MFLNTIVVLKQTHKQVLKNPSMCPKYTIDPIAFFTNDKHGLLYDLRWVMIALKR